jgi:hypothetical protein
MRAFRAIHSGFLLVALVSTQAGAQELSSKNGEGSAARSYAPGPERTKAQEIHDRFFIGFEASTGPSENGAASKKWTQPWQGKSKKPLNGADFYRALGRRDLAAKYDSAQENKVAVTVVGALVLAAGAWLALSGLEGDPSSNPSRSSDGSNGNRGLLGILVMAMGVSAVTVPWTMSSQPVDAIEARRLADEHNEKLKAKLGLSKEDEAPSSLSDSGASPRLILSPVAFASSTGAALGVAGRF